MGGWLVDSRQSGYLRRLRRWPDEGDSRRGTGCSACRFAGRQGGVAAVQRGRWWSPGGHLQRRRRGGLGTPACLPAVRQHGHDALGHHATADMLPR